MGKVLERESVVDRKRLESGCFVLLTIVPAGAEDGYESAQILEAYKDQHAVERNFSFLKDDAIVNAIFLKTPKRIEALGFILLISLLIWRLMEREMRTYLEREDAFLPGWDKKPTKRPTAYMLTVKFKWMMIVKIGDQRLIAKPIAGERAKFLAALSFEASIFTKPPDGSPKKKIGDSVGQ